MRKRSFARPGVTRLPGLWLVVALGCRLIRATGWRRAHWSYRLGVALERAGRLAPAAEAYTTASRLAPAGYEPPPPPPQWDAASVAFLRELAVAGLRRQQGIGLGGLLRRRIRVVPVVPRATRRAWERAAATDPAARLHLLYLRHRDAYLPAYFARGGGYPAPRTRLTRAWRWYLGDVLIPAIRLVRRNGRAVRAAVGLSPLRQLGQLLRLSVRLPAVPDAYYRYEFYRPEQRRRADAFLHGHECSSVLYEMLAEVAGDVSEAPLADKVAFAAHARAHGLAAVPTLAVVEHGQVVTTTGPLPTVDLFVKPRSGKRGLNAARWAYRADADAYLAADEKTPVPRDGFLEWLAARSPGGAMLVQPCLTNHPELADLALDALVTCRIVTMTDEHGRPEPVIATFRMPATRGVAVDNMHRGGIAAPIDITTGTLGAASGYAVAGPPDRYARHPVTGAVIEGRRLPCWDEVVDAVCRAHDAFRPRLLIGWDVSIGPDGPVLLEGNERPGVGGLQRLHDTPLGSHRFGQLLAHHLTTHPGPAGSRTAAGVPAQSAPAAGHAEGSGRAR